MGKEGESRKILFEFDIVKQNSAVNIKQNHMLS